MRRIALAAAVLLPGGCGAADERPVIDCAWEADMALAPACTIERLDRDMLLVSRPDGGFRRLHVSGDGAISAADGAEPAEVTRVGDVLVVAFGEERYRLTMDRLQ